MSRRIRGQPKVLVIDDEPDLLELLELTLDVPVAVITAYGSAENAVAALKAGAFDYLAKPVALEQLRALVKQALKVPEKAQVVTSYQLLGESPAMMQVRSLIDRLAKSQAPVFINGESGCG